MASPDPVLHIVAGPNGSGKSTLCRRVLAPTTGLPFVKADDIALRRWPGRGSSMRTTPRRPRSRDTSSPPQPEVKIRELADMTYIYDNSIARQPFRLLATYEFGRLLGTPSWPGWTPTELR